MTDAMIEAYFRVRQCAILRTRAHSTGNTPTVELSTGVVGSANARWLDV